MKYLQTLLKSSKEANDVIPCYTVIIIDDLMYLHSMRREIYVITRDENIPLLTIRVRTSLDFAILRNSLRPMSIKISNETISKIFENFQEPNNSIVAERLNYIVDNTSDERWALD